MDAILLPQALLLIYIDRSDLDGTLEQLCGLLPAGLELLAVAAPGRIKFHEPHLIGVQDLLLEV